jgi:hypothetical protein
MWIWAGDRELPSVSRNFIFFILRLGHGRRTWGLPFLFGTITPTQINLPSAFINLLFHNILYIFVALILEFISCQLILYLFVKILFLPFF